MNIVEVVSVTIDVEVAKIVETVLVIILFKLVATSEQRGKVVRECFF
jgi:hypothetical protein